MVLAPQASEQKTEWQDGRPTESQTMLYWDSVLFFPSITAELNSPGNGKRDWYYIYWVKKKKSNAFVV